jgi:hypothetical protein
VKLGDVGHNLGEPRYRIMLVVEDRVGNRVEGYDFGQADNLDTDYREVPPPGPIGGAGGIPHHDAAAPR